ncbi:MAG: hypothetical protein ACRCYY_18440 [Trueperaceae bacterium]
MMQPQTKPHTSKLQQTARKLGLSVSGLEQYLNTKVAESVTVKLEQKAESSVRSSGMRQKA